MIRRETCISLKWETRDAKIFDDDDAFGRGGQSGSDRADWKPALGIAEARTLAGAGRAPPAARRSGATREKPERSEQSGQPRGCRARPLDQKHLPRLLSAGSESLWDGIAE